MKKIPARSKPQRFWTSASQGPTRTTAVRETLEDAVDLMLKGGNPNQWLDEKNLADAKKANLSDDEKADLLAFCDRSTSTTRSQSRRCPSRAAT